jgi:myo-inositol-1(or 4)-monophosphatase
VTGAAAETTGARSDDESHEPPEADLGDELGFAIELAARAGRLLMDRYERVERIDYKSARDVVTEVDHLSEELILEAIRREYPRDGILAEESGEHEAVRSVKPPVGSVEAPQRVWVVDPIDGTINYANGIPFFCVSIAMLVDGQPAVGVVHDPTRQESFCAALGVPARLDGRPIVPSDKERLSDFVISLSLAGRAVARRGQAVRKAIRVPRSMGSAALALAYVANGRFDAFVQQGGLSAWDVAAAGLIAQRAGATVTDLAGGDWFDVARGPRSIGLVAAPPAHHEALLGLVRG